MSARDTRRAKAVARAIAPGVDRIALAIRSPSALVFIAVANSSTLNCHRSSARICCGALPSARRRSRVPDRDTRVLANDGLRQLEDAGLDRPAHERADISRRDRRACGIRAELLHFLFDTLGVAPDR